MNLYSLLTALLVVMAAVPVGSVGFASQTHANASVDEPPLPDAGLDQTVPRGSHVLLDGTGSRDPDGRLVAYDWIITAPDGSTTQATNGATPRASFVATNRGRYEVSLTVTDNSGATRTDTMYVTVERGEAPSVRVDGPATSTAGASETYTAAIERGAAPPTTIVWRVDGVRIASRSLRNGQRESTLSHTFGATGPHRISAVVYDDDQLNDSATNEVRVQAIQTAPALDSSIASRRSPTVDGPQLLTGEQPFSGDYEVTGAPSTVRRSITWRTEKGVVGKGTGLRMNWTPGDHTLYAVVLYTDGSKDIARFDDEETSVVVDPTPTLDVQNLVTSGQVAGDAVATDGYGNLQSVRVELDGERIGRWPRNLVDTGRRLSDEKRLAFSKLVEPNRESTLTVTATDARGQSVTISKRITVVGVPEIVSSGFVNTPVDSYHARIDPSRYTAKHVMRVDLNGADPESINLDVNYGGVMYVGVVNNRNRVISDQSIDGNAAVFVTYMKADVPGEYPIRFRLTQNGGSIQQVDATLSVEPSPPELRLNVTHAGTFRQEEWGMVIDAGESFDPDGTSVEYVWGEGAEPTSTSDSVAKFSAYDNANVTVRDADGQVTSRNHSFHQFYAPRIGSVQPIEPGPYLPNQTVTFNVSTHVYDFSKEIYQADIGIRVNGIPAEVASWNRIQRYSSTNLGNQRQWVGRVEVPASALSSDPDAVVEVYNKENPSRIKHRKQFPEVTVLLHATTTKHSVFATDLRYVAVRPQFDQRTVDSLQEKNRLLLRGYNLTDTEVTDTKQTIEKRVKVEDAQYRTDTEQFHSTNRRNVFVQSAPEWSIGGSTIVTETIPVTETEWRDERGGSGTFTGDTRQKKTDGADYKRWNKYEYEREVTKTETRYDWDYRTRVVEETRTRTVTHCGFFGCYEYDKEYTVDVRESYRVRVRETHTYTTTERETYWSFHPRRAGHEFTGESKLVKVDPADYTTQYEYRIETTREETSRLYEATRTVQIAPPQYEWRHDRTVAGRIDSYRITRDPSLRVTSAVVSREWTLRKHLGMSKVISNTYIEEENVIETRATVLGVVVERALNPENGTIVTANSEWFREAQTRDGVATSDDFLSETQPDVPVCDIETRGREPCESEYR